MTMMMTMMTMMMMMINKKDIFTEKDKWDPTDRIVGHDPCVVDGEYLLLGPILLAYT